MSDTSEQSQAMLAENEQLRARLAEAEELLRAIRVGEVDALVVDGAAGPQLFTLEGLDAESNRFRGEILAQVSDAVIAVDNDQRITYLNAAAEQQYGVHTSHMLGRQLGEMYETRWLQPRDEAAALKSLKDTGYWRGETLHVTPDGRELNVESTLTTLHDPDGAPDGRVAVVRDVTARKNVEEAMQKSEARLTLAVKCSQVVLFQQDLELRYTWLQNAVPGFKESVAIGKRDSDLMERAADAASTEALKREVLRSGVSQRQEVLVQVAGVGRHYDLVVEPKRDATGLITGVTCAAIDITARKQAEEAMRVMNEALVLSSIQQHELTDKAEGLTTQLRSEITVREQAHQALAERTALLNGVLEGTTDVIYVKDLNGRLMLANAAFAAAARSTPEQLVGKTDDDWFPPDVAAAVRQQDETVIAGGAPMQFEDTLPVAGEARVFLSLKAPLRDSSGRVVGLLGISRDITERKAADDELRRQKDLLRSITDTTTDLVFVKDPDCKLMFANPATLSVLGLTESQAIGVDVEALYPDPAQAEAVRANDRRILTAGTAETVEEVHTGPHGTRTYLSTKTPMRDQHGAVVALVGISHDITMMRQADDRLRQSEARLRRVFESNVIGMIRWDLDRSLILDANAEFLRMTGYAREDLTDGALNFRTLTPPEWTDRNEGGIQTLRTDGFAAAYEKEYFRKDGSRVPLIIAGTRFEDSPSEGMSFLIDISDRKRAEEKLRESEARLGGILRRSPAGIVQTDAAGCMTLVNPRWCEMFGYTETEMLGRNIIEITHPSSVAPTEAAFNRLAGGGPDFQIEKTYCRKDGSILRAQSNVAAIRSPDGKFLGLIAVVLDISERLRAEEELRRLAAELSDTDRRKDEFLATLAHELRNPLAAVRSAVQILCKLGSAAQPKLAGLHNVIDRQSAHMIRLIDDLMDVGRITRGKVVLKRQTVDLVEIVREASGTAVAAYADRNHDVKLILPERPLRVDGDPLRLAQIVSNLLSNSCRYTDAGGTIEVSLSREGERREQAVVRVKDNGIGISASMLPRIFETFTQADTSLERTTARAGGLGIGLALVKSLVEQHGGSVEARSEGLGKGSEFVVRIPALPSEPEVLANQPPVMPTATDEVHAGASGPLQSLAAPGEGLTQAPRVLVVDDNVDAAECVALLLRSDGYTTHTAHDGQEAVEQAIVLEPDIVLLDIGLPRLNGYDACRMIREKLRRHPPVMIAITGWGQDGDRQKSQEAGFNGHLVKPVDFEALTRLLPELMAKRPSSTEPLAGGVALG